MESEKAYYRAEKLINAAIRSGAYKLNLPNLDLEVLPESIGKLKNLESLNLPNNNLKVLPESLGQLKKLRSINLSNNYLSFLPESFGQLIALQSIILYSNNLTSIPESIGNLHNVQSINLLSNRLTFLPDTIGSLINLTSLNIASNNLIELPTSISLLRNLKSLILSFNRINTLHESICRLNNLKLLLFANNELSQLPESIGHLINLHTLDLSFNDLVTVPNGITNLTNLRHLDLSHNNLKGLPKTFHRINNLQFLSLSYNYLDVIPTSIGSIKNLQHLDLKYNNNISIPKTLINFNSIISLSFSSHSGKIPEWLKKLKNLQVLEICNSQLTEVPDWICNFPNLEELSLAANNLVDIPVSLTRLKNLKRLDLESNPLNPELAEAYKEGLSTLFNYLLARSKEKVVINEVKLIIVGEGEVGKSCLLSALNDDPWEENRPTTHGIEIKQIHLFDPESEKEIILNGWDFGGQRVYRPTHQLFFSSPAVYLVVWKPREGSQQGSVKEWIKLIKHREPDAKILVVATHGGPLQRQPDIDRQEIWDLFGKDLVIDFFHVENKPDHKGFRRGILSLKNAIAKVAINLPEVGRTVPKSWNDVHSELQKSGKAYLPIKDVTDICRNLKMDDEEVRLFITISHRLGHLIHYQHDPLLRGLVILKPDWLANAISYVLDDEQTRNEHGLVRFGHLSKLWNDPTRDKESRYPLELHPVFLRLMERFDLSYRVAGLSLQNESDETSLIAQLVPDVRPEVKEIWPEVVPPSDSQQVQICRIVDSKNGQQAAAEGLFYQLIVRLHKYSIGRVDYEKSVHWQRGLVLDNDYNGRAILEYIGTDVRISVRAPYPETFLAILTNEVKWLVESFWSGLNCEVMVPCISPCGNNEPGSGLYEVKKLIESKRENRNEYPCPLCNKWQNIDSLLRNAITSRPLTAETLFAEFSDVRNELATVRQELKHGFSLSMGRFDNIDTTTQIILSKIDDAFSGLMKSLTDEAKEGPRLFSLVPVNRSNFNPKKWTSEKFRLTLWCEHSRLPLPELNEKGSKQGIIELDITREWYNKAAPFLKVLTGALSLVLPVASSAVKLALDETAYKAIENELDFGKSCIESTLKGSEAFQDWFFTDHSAVRIDREQKEQTTAISAHGGILREFHALLKVKDPSFGGLIRVQNKRHEFLWVHPRFEKEY